MDLHVQFALLLYNIIGSWSGILLNLLISLVLLELAVASLALQLQEMSVFSHSIWRFL